MLRLAIACLGFSLVAGAREITLERLYTRPFVWGAKPHGLAVFNLSRDGSLAASEYKGDLYVVRTDSSKPLEVELWPWRGKACASVPEWSPDSRLLLSRIHHPRMKQSQILVTDAKTGKAKVVYEETGEKWVNWLPVGWSPDSRFVFFVAERDGWAHLCTIPADSGTPQQLTRGQWEIDSGSFSSGPQWVGEYLYFISTEGGTSERHFYRIRPDGAGKERLSRSEGLNVGLVPEAGKHTDWMLADLRRPWDLWVDDRRVTESQRAEFAVVAWPETRFVEFPSRRDGKTVRAKLLLPPGYRPEDRGAQPRPAVFFIHGSGYATSVLKQWGSYNELRFAFNCCLARKGYVVLAAGHRGSSGYGRNWRTDLYLQLGGPDLDDVLGGIDYLAKLGNIDTRRIGAWGVTYGGFLTNMAMFRAPDSFRAGVPWAAVNDWENYSARYTTPRLTTPEENPEAYRRSSPIHFSGPLRNPLLIVHGMVDDNVLFQDAVQLTAKLIQEGKPFSHAYYPQEDHGFVRDEMLVDAFRRTAEWFEEHLK